MPKTEYNPQPLPLVNTQIVLQGFGLLGVRSLVYGAQIDAEGFDENAPTDRTSYLGMPVFDTIEFKPSEYNDKNNNPIEYGNILKNSNSKNPSEQGGDFFRVDSVLIDVSQQKQIIKTNIQGVAGTVKEFISMGDYQIMFRGFLTDPNSGRYPHEQVRQMRQYLEAETTLEINSRFLNDIFDITNIVVESFSFPQREGFQNQQAFEISCISDEPLELTVLTQNG